MIIESTSPRAGTAAPGRELAGRRGLDRRGSASASSYRPGGLPPRALLSDDADAERVVLIGLVSDDDKLHAVEVTQADPPRSICASKVTGTTTGRPFAVDLPEYSRARVCRLCLMRRARLEHPPITEGDL